MSNKKPEKNSGKNNKGNFDQIEFIDHNDFDLAIKRGKTEKAPKSCASCKYLLTCQPINCPFV